MKVLTGSKEGLRVLDKIHFTPVGETYPSIPGIIHPNQILPIHGAIAEKMYSGNRQLAAVLLEL